jgi:hypothetical protein
MESRPLHQRPHLRQDSIAARRHSDAEQLVAAAGGLHQAQKHPDGRGLARPVRAEEAVDGAGRDGQLDVVDGELTAAEPLRQAAAGNGRRGGAAGDGRAAPETDLVSLR